MRIYRILFVLITGSLFISCTSIRDYFIKRYVDEDDERTLRIHSQRPFPENITEIIDIPYIDSGDTGHLLDIYYPNNTEGPFPVIINIHGGGFLSESKETNRLFSHHLAEKGFILFNINYRLALEGTKVPGQIQDVVGAMDWIGKNMASYPANTEKIYIMGASAGAYLAVMATLVSESQRLQDVFSISKPDIRISALAVTSSFLMMESKRFRFWSMKSVVLERGYQRKEYYRDLIFKNLPEIVNLPPVFITSNEDDFTNFMSFNFADLLKERNVEHKFHYIENTGGKLRHGFNIWNPAREESVRLHDEMLEYLMRY
jgi:acetyl esterase/lipase